MSQSRAMSLFEAVANVVLGCAVAMVAQLLAFPVVGIQAGMSQHLLLSGIFTGVSLVRSYALRRLFNRIATGPA